MSNSKEAYQTRMAGLSPDFIRDHIVNTYSKSWKNKALDLGTGRGGFAQRLINSEKFSTIHCMDIVDCREGDCKSLPFHLVDLAKDSFPEETETFDFIFAIEVIEHIENPRHFIREIYRLLKPGGIFTMSTPNVDSLKSRMSFLLRGYYPPFCEKDYQESGHISPMSQLDFKRICSEAGFDKVQNNFELPGRMPSLKLNWQSIFPFLEGKFFSDSYISIVEKTK